MRSTQNYWVLDVRLPTQREIQYDVTDSLGAPIRFQSRVFGFYSTHDASGRQKLNGSTAFSSYSYALVFMHSIKFWLGFLHNIFTSLSILFSTLFCFITISTVYFFCYILLTNLFIIIYYS
jgi:hypothetical protein